MGRRGPKPQPTALKIARGNPHGHALNHDEPDFDAPTTTKPPRGLKGIARKEWIEQVDVLIAKGVLTAQDMTAFWRYCKLLGRVDALEKHLEQGEEFSTEWMRKTRLLSQLDRDLRQAAAGFGITPSSRSGVKTVKAPASAADQQRKRFFGARKEKPA